MCLMSARLGVAGRGRPIRETVVPAALDHPVRCHLCFRQENSNSGAWLRFDGCCRSRFFGSCRWCAFLHCHNSRRRHVMFRCAEGCALPEPSQETCVRVCGFRCPDVTAELRKVLVKGTRVRARENPWVSHFCGDSCIAAFVLSAWIHFPQRGAVLARL